MFPAIFLDRDGVIIENCPDYVRSWADVAIFPQALDALARIRNAPYKLIMVTNQSVVGRGLITFQTAQAINDRLVAEIEAAGGRMDAVLMCPHAPQDGCDCRKPKPGLLYQATRAFDLNLGQSILIGDAQTDLLAGQSAGVERLALVRTGRGGAQSAQPKLAGLATFPVYADLWEALGQMLSSEVAPS